MANPDTDLLGAHRRKTLRHLLLGAAGVAVLVAVLFVAFVVLQPSRAPTGDVPVPDAAVAEARAVDAAVPVDADNRGMITALSRYGFLSLAATAKTTIYIDGKLIGEAPLTRLPLAPGMYKVRAVGPRGKAKTFKVNIYGGQDTDEGTINW